MAAAAVTAEPQSTTAADKLSFVPSKSVTFMPNTSKQMAEMAITNESDKNVMFKMKSTRPGMFKMRPVYGVIPPNEECLYSARKQMVPLDNLEIVIKYPLSPYPMFPEIREVVVPA
nr:Major sperm protein domain containing protein [Haemonchus contortus]